MNAAPAVLAVEPPDEAFSEDAEDEDPYCIHVGMGVSRKLGAHLKQAGHSIPDWLGDGCEEDAWVHLESQVGDRHYVYTIVFFPHDGHDSGMAIQYAQKFPLMKRIFRKPDAVESGDPLHQVLRDFGAGYDYSRMLTREEFDALY